MTYEIPVRLRGADELLTVDYGVNESPAVSGFDALELPFPASDCIGYPTVHAYFRDMKLTGYRRYCGFIQLICMRGRRDGAPCEPERYIDVDEYFTGIGDPYFAYGYPASLYDAPCRNLRDCDFMEWTAYTYLVDMPTRMNGGRLGFIAGFTWGYDEDAGGVTAIHELKQLTDADFDIHLAMIRERCPGCGK